MNTIAKPEKTAATREHTRTGKRAGASADPASMLDVRPKSIHEYRRQLLNGLHIVTLYEGLKAIPNLDIAPRTFIFGGKAAPSYYMAKLIIKLINSVAEGIDKDPQVNGTQRVAFMPDFNVKNGQRLYPAADSAGIGCPSSTWRAWASSPRTPRSGTTASG